MFFPPRLFRAAPKTSRQLFIRCLVTPSRPSSSKPCDPLRILFFGSDAFSEASLRVLEREWKDRGDSGIESIDVVCRPGKATGRGLKVIKHPRILEVAGQLNIPLHEVDNFSGWTPPKGINLIIAVSFGLLIPSRIIQAAKYGGLNVHPSILPDLRGAAPIEHALLQQRRSTGVSLQTLHPTKFDHGVVIAQTPYPWIPIPQDATPKEVECILAEASAELLIDGLRSRSFLEPLQPIQLSQLQIKELTSGNGIARAPKITQEDRRIDWDSQSSIHSIPVRQRVLGRLWDDTTYSRATGTTTKRRIIYDKWEAIDGGASDARLPIDNALAIVRTPPLNPKLKSRGDFSVRLETTSRSEDGRHIALSSNVFTVEYGNARNGAAELKAAVMKHRSQEDKMALLKEPFQE